MNTARARIGIVLASLLTMFGVALVVVPLGWTASAAPKHTPVGVCHATSSDTNPYVWIVVDADATKYRGHLMHRDEPNKTWKSAGVWNGIEHAAGSPKRDYIEGLDPKASEAWCGAASGPTTPPATTSAPATTTAPATTSAPATTTAPATTSAPATTTAPATTSPATSTPPQSTEPGTVPPTTTEPGTTPVSTEPGTTPVSTTPASQPPNPPLANTGSRVGGLTFLGFGLILLGGITVVATRPRGTHA